MDTLQEILTEFKPRVVHHYGGGCVLEFADDMPFTVQQAKRLEKAFQDHELVEAATFMLDSNSVGLTLRYSPHGKRDQRAKEAFSELIKPQFRYPGAAGATILRRQGQAIAKLVLALPVDFPTPNLPELRELSSKVLVSRYEPGTLTVSLSAIDHDEVRALTDTIAAHLNVHIGSFTFEDPDPDAALFPAEM